MSLRHFPGESAPSGTILLNGGGPRPDVAARRPASETRIATSEGTPIGRALRRSGAGCAGLINRWTELERELAAGSWAAPHHARAWDLCGWNRGQDRFEPEAEALNRLHRAACDGDDPASRAEAL